MLPRKYWNEFNVSDDMRKLNIYTQIIAKFSFAIQYIRMNCMEYEVYFIGPSMKINLNETKQINK